MTATGTRTHRNRKQPERKIRWAARIAPGVGVLRIEQDQEESFYFVGRLESDYGAGFWLEKIDRPSGEITERYCLNIHGDESTCECKGWLRWGRCKHVAGLSALIQRNAL